MDMGTSRSKHFPFLFFIICRIITFMCHVITFFNISHICHINTSRGLLVLNSASKQQSKGWPWLGIIKATEQQQRPNVQKHNSVSFIQIKLKRQSKPGLTLSSMPVPYGRGTLGFKRFTFH